LTNPSRKELFMADEKYPKENVTGMENLEVEPLSDEDLESVAGGVGDALSDQVPDCSCGSTGGNCTS
jgi:hypothetical protein